MRESVIRDNRKRGKVGEFLSENIQPHQPILTGSPCPGKYRIALKKKLQQEGSELSHNLGQLKMEAGDGKQRMTIK
jgi:hypothetical protein